MKLIQAVCLLLLSYTVQAQLSLAPIFSDHAVLQRDMPVKLWGWASVNASVDIYFDAQKLGSATADDTGKWLFEMPAQSLGPAHNIKVTSASESLTITDIVYGDVWLCSGQSNMEWIIKNANDYEAAKAAATDQMIRHIKIPTSYAFAPDAKMPDAQWMVTTPEVVGEFSAVGYYFAKAVKSHHDVPIGILHSSWGGSSIEAWMNATSLGIDDTQVFMDSLQGEYKKESQKLIDFIKKKHGKTPTPKDEGLRGERAVYSANFYQDSKWPTMQLPNRWESQGYKGMDGSVWFRKTFELTEAEAEQAGQISLAQIDDSDRTFVNGFEVGGMKDSWNVKRVYDLKPVHLRAGKNYVTIRVEDNYGGGGVHGEAADMFIQVGDTKKSLAGDWKYAIGAFKTSRSYNQTPMALYNKMLYPLREYGIKGVLWYQGESNTRTEERAQAYRKQFANMIFQWRKDFGIDFPFYYVQLANFMAETPQPQPSRWATLRQSQTEVQDIVPNTGQAVIIDIGEAEDIHPRNKKEVGRRLALLARKHTYGEAGLVADSPRIKAAKLNGDKIVMEFYQVGEGLQVLGAVDELPNIKFAIAGADEVFQYVEGTLNGQNTLVIKVPKGTNVKYVSYCWDDNPGEVLLFNSAGLPVTPFKLIIE